MMNLKTPKKTAGAFAISSAALMLCTPAFAHSGHSHAQNDILGGILHTLTTHPLLFGIVGLALAIAAYTSQKP